MKRAWISWWRIAIAILFLLSLTSWAIAQEAKPGAGMYFRFVTHGGDDPFWAVVQKGAADAAKELGCKVDFDLCGGDLALQQKRFQEAVALKPDGIALVINDDTAWDKPVEEALAQGIPVIGINNDDSEGAKGNKRLCYIGQNEKTAAYRLAIKLFEEAKAKGIDLSKAHVAMAAEVPGANYAKIRASGVLEAMKEYGITSYEIIDAGGLEMTTVESRETSYLLAHPETTFLIGLGGICTDRLTASLKAAGFEPGEIIAGGFDTTPDTLNGIREGYITATIDQQQYLQGYFGVYVLYLYNKYGFTPNIDTGGYLVDSPEKISLIEKLSPLHIR
ncbi:MAG: substrate-binding domain-containing protein [Candidatus Atribacteria bacterium]|nr:substrate-binding domain-containing protein [Candidatus Atribacteria bacterium]MCD6349386.1 substrate-binding domain-containing protein [Candidatus Atribacteria bacterium]